LNVLLERPGRRASGNKINKSDSVLLLNTGSGYKYPDLMAML
jgi:hypothetical protein